MQWLRRPLGQRGLASCDLTPPGRLSQLHRELARYEFELELVQVGSPLQRLPRSSELAESELEPSSVRAKPVTRRVDTGLALADDLLSGGDQRLEVGELASPFGEHRRAVGDRLLAGSQNSFTIVEAMRESPEHPGRLRGRAGRVELVAFGGVGGSGQGQVDVETTLWSPVRPPPQGVFAQPALRSR